MPTRSSSAQAGPTDHFPEAGETSQSPCLMCSLDPKLAAITAKRSASLPSLNLAASVKVPKPEQVRAPFLLLHLSILWIEDPSLQSSTTRLSQASRFISFSFLYGDQLV